LPVFTPRVARVSWRLAILAALGAFIGVRALAEVGAPAEAAAAPTVNTISPGLGSRGGGTIVTITGTGFVVGATVTVGGSAATSVIVGGATSITATVPVGTPGPALIVITNPDGQSATLSNAFAYQDWPPTVTNVATNSGSSLGGTSVTITGANFVGGASASFGGTPATSVVVLSATTITAVTPAHGAGGVNVAVTNPDGQSGTLANAFTYVAGPAPTVASASPDNGTTGGGTAVTLVGTNFAAGATVTFGGTAATGVQVVSPTQITAISPAKAAGTVAVVVTNPDHQTGTLASGYTYALAPAPTVTSVSPKEGALAGGTVVTIVGSGFLGGATVSFGGTAGTGVTVTSTTSITVTTPAKTTSGAVTVDVKNTDNQAGSLATGYAYLDKATVAGVTPDKGPAGGGTSVKITGTNFGTAPTVRFGSTEATSVTASSTTEISAVTPAGTGTVDVTVTGPGGDGTKAAAFTYSASPTITQATPLEGPTAGGTTVTVTGSSLTSDLTVLFGDTAGTGLTVATNGNSLTVKSPARAAGDAAISIRLADGSSVSLSTPFRYVEAAAPGQIVSGTVTAGAIALVVFSGGSSDQLVAAATGSAACPTKDRLIIFALAEGKWVPFIPVAPAQVNSTWNQRYSKGLPADSALFVRCT